MGIITVLLVSVRQIGQGLIASRFSVFICKTTINFTFEYQDTKATFYKNSFTKTSIHYGYRSFKQLS